MDQNYFHGVSIYTRMSDIAHIYVILHSNHFIIISKATGYVINTRDQCTSRVILLAMTPKQPSCCSYLTSSSFAENDEMVSVGNYTYGQYPTEDPRLPINEHAGDGYRWILHGISVGP